MDRTPRQLMVYGRAHMTSPWFSAVWHLDDGAGTKLAELRRYPRMHVSTVHFPDGTAWLLEPDGWGTVRALDGHRSEVAQITRRSWLGRRWDVTSSHWAYALISDPVPRRWHLAVGDATVADISGSLVSYNSVWVDAALAVPAAAVILAWHVIARPWEAAAAPKGLVPVSAAEKRSSRPIEGAA